MYKLTVPNDQRSLEAAAEFFADLAGLRVTDKTDCKLRELHEKNRLTNDAPPPLNETVAPPPLNETVAPPPPNETVAPPPPATEVDVGAKFQQSAAPAVKLDSTNIPWDSRIHAGSKKFIADGTWRVKKCPIGNTKEEWLAYVDGVKIQLTNAVSVAAPPVTETQTGITTLVQLTEQITGMGITPEDLQAACVSIGIENYSVINSRLDLIPALVEALGLN